MAVRKGWKPKVGDNGSFTIKTQRTKQDKQKQTQTMANSRKICENHSQLVFEKHSDWKLVIDLFFAQGICICYNANWQAKGQPEGVGSLLR